MPFVPEEAAPADEAEEFNPNPNALLDHLVKHLKLKNDAALSRLLEVQPPVVSKLRHGRLPVGPTMLIKMHEVSDIEIRELRRLMGDRRKHFRMPEKAEAAEA